MRVQKIFKIFYFYFFLSYGWLFFLVVGVLIWTIPANCFSASLHIGGAYFSWKNFKVLFKMLFFLCRWKILLYFGADRCALDCGVSMAARTCASDGGNWLGCPRSETDRVSQWCGLPKARVLWSNSPFVCKRWLTFVSAFVFWQQRFACLQSSHRMDVKYVSVCWLVTLRTYVVSVSWVWCEQIVCSECVCRVRVVCASVCVLLCMCVGVVSEV